MTSTSLPLTGAAFPGPAARRWARFLGELLLAVTVTTSALVSLLCPPSQGILIGFFAALLPAAFLWLRHHHPVPVLGACLGLYALALFTAQFTPASVLPAAVALYAFAVRHPAGWRCTPPEPCYSSW